MSTVESTPVRRRLLALRNIIEKGFSPETAARGFRGAGPSTGQCAATALIAREVLGGDFVSAIVEDQSHWFNRVTLAGHQMDVDLTGDQFGRPNVQVAPVDGLYADTRVRDARDVNRETLERAIRLAEQAGLHDVRVRLEQWSHQLGSSDDAGSADSSDCGATLEPRGRGARGMDC